jgi:transcriptional regulator with XRE-family HTH domain
MTRNAGRARRRSGEKRTGSATRSAAAAGDPAAMRPVHPESDLVVVDDESGLRGMVADVLSPDRVCPVVGIASVKGGTPVASLGGVYKAVGGPLRVYLIAHELLGELQNKLGGKFALSPDSLRVWWPELTARSDPGDHPVVYPLEGQSESDMLVELARQFNLSRPGVREEIKLIEDQRRLAEQARETAEDQSVIAAEHARDALIERHREATRAKRAETKLEITRARRELRLVGLGPDKEETDSTLRMFGTRLKALRVAAGLSQRDLAQRCFATEGDVSRLERGINVPSLLVLGVLARALGVSVGDLTDGLAPTVRQASTTAILDMAAREPRPDTRALVESLGLPASYVRQTLDHLRAFDAITAGKDGWEPATQHEKTSQR